MPSAYFGIESSGLSLAIDLLILFVVVLYFALIYWTYADARRRIADQMLVGCAVFASLFPFVGPIIYMVVRPPEYLEDVHERELETQAAQARLSEAEQALCPYCSYRIESDFIRCPSCLRKLKERCVSCSRPLDQAWTICPYCEADVPGLSSTRSRRRRGAKALGGELAELALSSEGDPVAASDGDATATASERALASASSTEAEAEPLVSPPRPSRAGRSGSRPRPSS